MIGAGVPWRMAVGAAVVLGSLGAPAWGAETYRWVDESGRVNYSDRPPPQNVRKVIEKQLGDAPADSALPYTTRKAATDFPVALYTSDNCGGLCDEARNLLTRRGVPFAEHKLATEADITAYRERFGTPDEVPAISVGNQAQKGYEAGRWTRMLDDAGYPKAAPPSR